MWGKGVHTIKFRIYFCLSVSSKIIEDTLPSTVPGEGPGLGAVPSNYRDPLLPVHLHTQAFVKLNMLYIFPLFNDFLLF